MLQIVAIELINVLLDVSSHSVCVVTSKSPPVLFNAVIQNLLGHYIAWVIYFDLKRNHKFHSSWTFYFLLTKFRCALGATVVVFCRLYKSFGL